MDVSVGEVQILDQDYNEELNNDFKNQEVQKFIMSTKNNKEIKVDVI
jgi:hypothetical protein